MKAAKPVWEGMDTHGFGLGALLLALLVPGSAWLVASASMPAPQTDDARRIEFVRSAAGIQGRVHLLRELEKSQLASATSVPKSDYYRQRRAEERQRIDALARRAAAAAEGREEQARLAHLAALVRTADTRYEQILASAGEAQGAQRLAMQK